MNKQWVAEEQFEGDESCGIAIMEGREEIVRVRGIGIADFENAQLIAAAPDLLATLRELVRYVRDEFSCSHPLCEAADRAHAAIAKATGEQLSNL